ncbi:DNA-3-methyladenine glycosylase [Candidatus Dojkabacteria bacterium]|nr:DNA-3-methyladenine glycosylase [Candidatus Dojkabacteria bacterium]
MMLPNSFFARDPLEVAKSLIGKVLCHKYDDIWLKAMIIEAEAYYADEPGSHASKGRTKSKEALYMQPGTIYMYYSRGSDSIGFSTFGAGSSILIKSGIPFIEGTEGNKMIRKMHELNPINGRMREDHLLCSGQTLISKSLGLKVKNWNKKKTDAQRLYVDDIGYTPKSLIACRRLGMSKRRHYQLMHRIFDPKYAKSITKDPTSKNSKEGVDFKYV